MEGYQRLEILRIGVLDKAMPDFLACNQTDNQAIVLR
jgi:hypothetical protein